MYEVLLSGRFCGDGEVEKIVWMLGRNYREMKSLYEETYWCPPRFLGVLRDNTLKNLF